MSSVTNDQNLPARQPAPTPSTAMRIAQPQGGAMQTYQAPPPSRYEGEEPEDSILPRVHLFQGTGKEKEMFGKGPASGGTWQDGDLIDTLAREKIADKRFVPLFGWNQFIFFILDNKGKPTGQIKYQTRNKAEVPAADLVWGANGEKPGCTKFMNFAVLFPEISYPLVISFKTTSLQAGRSLNALERVRGHKGPGLYSFDTREKSNTQGKWLTPIIRPMGNPPADLSKLAADMFSTMTPSAVGVEIDSGLASEDDGGSGDGSGSVPAGGVEFDPSKL